MSSNTKEIKRRIKSISNTMQVTKALELISSIKMRKAIAIAAGSRDFAGEIWQLITKLRGNAGDNPPALFTPQNNTSKMLIVLIASDKGLAGSYNSNVLRTTARYINDAKVETDIVTVGKKAVKILHFISSVNIISSFEQTGDGFDFFEASPISKFVLDSFLAGNYRKIAVAYTDFVNTLKQVATVRTILPIESDNSIENSDSRLRRAKLGLRGNDIGNDGMIDITGYKYEPDKMSILTTLGKLAVRSQIYQALLEASASEHAARMVAMKNATENGNELVDDLKFTFNQLRQQGITQEIAEISAGRIALGNT